MNNLKILKLSTDAVAIFRERPNKYIAVVDIIEPFNEKNVLAHVHDPGRLNEILYTENKVLLKYENKPTRKTKWDVIAGNVSGNYILIHSGYHRKIAESFFRKKVLPFLERFQNIKAEVKYKNHRIDFLATDLQGNKCWIEVKGCTLGRENIALFPDAPTIRGEKHLKTLIELKDSGDEAILIVLIFAPDVTCFMPNSERDKKFSDTFREVIKKGIKIYPLLFSYDKNYIIFNKKIDICKEF